jgi:predicted AlkP superfamily phosphohydrolase/phosphomutase
MDRERLLGVVAGFGYAGLPGFFACVVCWLWNPLFVDEPISLWLALVMLPGLLGALISLGGGYRARGRWPLGLSVGTLTLITGFSIPTGQRLDSTQLVILGVDGATWSVIEPMVQRGELEAFAAMRSAGASGVMQAPQPIFSPLIWTTLATGLESSEHGISGFSMEATALKAPRFWNIAENQGLSVGVYKWLVTWPPESLAQGFMVPAWLAKSAQTTPARLGVVKELELSQRRRRKAVVSERGLASLTPDLIRVGLRWSTLRDACWWRLRIALGMADPLQVDAALQQIRVAIDWDVFVAALWAEKPDVASFSLYATDALSHRFWRYHEPARFEGVSAADVSRHGEVVQDAYRQADRILAELTGLVGEDTRLVVISDHGFQALQGDGGLRMLPRTEPVERWFRSQGLQLEVLRQGAKLRVISREARLREQLEAFVDANGLRTGQPVYRVEVIPERGDALGLAVIAEHLDPEAELMSGEKVLSLLKPAEGFSGDHHPEGIFMARGPGVASGTEISIQAVDFTPVVLAALGIPQGADMPGEVPDGLWPSPGTGPSWSWLLEHVTRAPSEEAVTDETDQALRALGYID